MARYRVTLTFIPGVPQSCSLTPLVWLAQVACKIFPGRSHAQETARERHLKEFSNVGET